MLALRKKSHCYEASNLYIIPKNIHLYFGANVKVLLGIATYFLSLYVPLLFQDGF